MLQREREVGNVFRLFRNPDEEYDNYAAPTAIKVIDHDKQRWAMLTLGDILARTGVWSGQKNDVTMTQVPFSSDHLANLGRKDHPLKTLTELPMQVFGDLDVDYKMHDPKRFATTKKISKLSENTLRAAVRSIERAVINANATTDAEILTKLRSICNNNVWFNTSSNDEAKIFNVFPGYHNGTYNISDDDVNDAKEYLYTEIGSSAATASVQDIADALQNAMIEAVVADDPTPEVTAKVNSERIRSVVDEVVSITSDMSDTQRGSIASAIVGAASGFKSSKSALRKVIRNKDNSKQDDIDAAYGEALKKDMASNWKSINSEAKKIAANIGLTAGGSRQNNEVTENFRIRLKAIEGFGFSRLQRAIARWYLGCSIDLPTIVSLDQQGIVTPFGAYVSCIYSPL